MNGNSESYLNDDKHLGTSQPSRDDYRIDIICSLSVMFNAVRAMFDEGCGRLRAIEMRDHNVYHTGRMRQHNIVIACLPASNDSPVTAASVAKDMVRSFKRLRSQPASRHRKIFSECSTSVMHAQFPILITTVMSFILQVPMNFENVAQKLLESGGDANEYDIRDETLLQKAAHVGNPAIVRLLLEHGADLNVPGGHYGTALETADQMGYPDVAELLIEWGAEE